MIRRAAAFLLLALGACDGVASDEGPVVDEKTTTTASSALTKIRRPDSLGALVQAGDPKLAATLTPAMAKQLQAELDAHRATFTFTKAPLLKADPGKPMTRSFQEDDWSLHVGLAAKLPAYAPGCVMEPCVLRLDLDGAGGRDAIVSAWDTVNRKYAVAVQTSTSSLLTMPLDLGKARWRVASASELAVSGFTRQGVLFESTAGATVRFLLFQDATGPRIVRL